MTRMNRCPHEGCHELKPVDSADCGNHKVKPKDCPSYPDYHKKQKALEREAKEETCQNWVPKPKPAPRMTDAAQRRHDKQLKVKLAEKCGYGHGEVKRLTAGEIAAIQGQITHISMVKEYSFSPGVGQIF